MLLRMALIIKNQLNNNFCRLSINIILWYFRWVLTAAHCVFGKNWIDLKVVLGDHNVTKKERQEIHVNICGMNVHHLYQSSGPTLHDIALLELCKNVRLSKKIRPIALASNNLSLPDLSMVNVAGWGAIKFGGSGTQILHKVTLRTTDKTICKAIYKWVSDGEICAGDINSGGKDSCQGDSGGALWYQHKKISYQVGIVSHGRGCARPGTPGVYTNVAHYRTWIEDNMMHRLDPSFLSKIPKGLINEFGALSFETTSSSRPMSPTFPKNEYKIR